MAVRVYSCLQSSCLIQNVRLTDCIWTSDTMWYIWNKPNGTSVWAAFCVVVVFLLANLHAAETETNDPASTFERDIANLFVTRCLTCHSANKPAGGLDLTTREALLAGGESGAALEPGNPDGSYLIERRRDAAGRQGPTTDRGRSEAACRLDRKRSQLAQRARAASFREDDRDAGRF